MIDIVNELVIKLIKRAFKERYSKDDLFVFEYINSVVNDVKDYYIANSCIPNVRQLDEFHKEMLQKIFDRHHNHGQIEEEKCLA